MKTQFHHDSTAKCSRHKAFPDWAKTQFDPIKTQLRPNSIMPRYRTLWLVTQRICRVVGQFTDRSSEFADSAGTVFRESTDNLPIFTRNLPILAVAELRNPSIIHRFGCRDQGVESSDNRQMIQGNHQIAPL